MNVAPLLTRLAAVQGKYQGDGFNHEGEKFEASFELKSELDGSLISITFRANDSEQAFHEERT